MPPEQLLLAAIADGTRTNAWLQTKDGATGRKRPESLVSLLLNEETEKKNDIVVFDSGQEFDKEWKRLTEKEK